MSESAPRSGILGDAAFMGLRSTLGVVFIVHGFGKIGNEGFIGFMGSMGIPPEMAMLIAAAELVPGIVLVIGVLSRIAASIISIIMVGAIFYIKKVAAFTGDGSYEFDLILLASCLVIIVMGPGRISLSHALRRVLPKFLH